MHFPPSVSTVLLSYLMHTDLFLPISHAILVSNGEINDTKLFGKQTWKNSYKAHITCSINYGNNVWIEGQFKLTK